MEILGHIFEQSITDLEEMHRAHRRPAGRSAGTGRADASGRRRARSTRPAFVTRYIVAETLGPVLRERFEALRVGTTKPTPPKDGRARLSTDPRAFDPATLNDPQTTALVEFWDAWLDELETVRVVDPACGSGAFLIEAFDQMFAEYQQAQGLTRPNCRRPDAVRRRTGPS